MTDPICLRVVVFQNETDEPAEAAINVPVLSRAMHLVSLLLWMSHFASVVPWDGSKQRMLPSRDKAKSCFPSFAQVRDRFEAELTRIGTSTRRWPS